MLGYNVAIGEKLDAKGVSLKVLEQADPHIHPDRQAHVQYARRYRSV
jgi:hypothetical protein